MVAGGGGGGGGGPKLVPVRGKITLGGGPWPRPGTVNFTSDKGAQGTLNRPATADFDAEGNFTATTFTAGDGLAPGKYKIGVTCWSVPMDMKNPAAARSAVPAKYSNPQTSGLEVTVEPGKPIRNLSLDVPKP